MLKLKLRKGMSIPELTIWIVVIVVLI